MSNSEFLELLPQANVEFISLVSREIRRVPLNYEHPMNENGNHNPLYGPNQGKYEPEEVQEMIDSGHIQSPEDMQAWYMPDFSDVPEEQMGICAYETCTEGTPISPVFPNTPQGKLELLKHVTEHETTFADQQTSIEGWAAILFGSNEVLSIVNIHDGTLTTTSRPAETL